ncbi:hypothetical protein N0M98_18310 [Paenibacillus doosanensis]|nr:hypothetical protein [Paenibacillus doosanensis]
MTNIGKPYEGKPHVRFDEEGQISLPFTLGKRESKRLQLQDFPSGARICMFMQKGASLPKQAVYEAGFFVVQAGSCARFSACWG